MADSDDPLSPEADDLVAGFVGMVPVAGALIAPFAVRLSRSVREEKARRSSEALRAAERVSGMSREELADRIGEDPRLIPLVVRVLYTAGMTGQDTTLRALGAALGEAVRDPGKIDYAELLLIGIADLREHHIVILRIMTRRLPHPTDPDTSLYWGLGPLTERSGYDRDLVAICLAGLVRSGLIRQVEDAYGVCYEISDLGSTALEVLDQYRNQDEES